MRSCRVGQVYNARTVPFSKTAPPSPDYCTVRLVCQSDTHTRWERQADNSVPPGDVYLHAGDFSTNGSIAQCLGFEKYVGELPHTKKFVIAGNHEVTFEETFFQKYARDFYRPTDPEVLEPARAKRVLSESTRLTYLEDSGVESCFGMKIWGSPWQPEFCDWAFNLPRNSKELARVWGLVPSDVDVLLTHGPPQGHGDRCIVPVNAGCEILMERVRDVVPALHLFGHIHEAYGVTRQVLGPARETFFVNASICTKRYQPTNPTIVVDMFVPREKLSPEDLGALMP